MPLTGPKLLESWIQRSMLSRAPKMTSITILEISSDCFSSFCIRGNLDTWHVTCTNQEHDLSYCEGMFRINACWGLMQLENLIKINCFSIWPAKHYKIQDRTPGKYIFKKFLPKSQNSNEIW